MLGAFHHSRSPASICRRVDLPLCLRGGPALPSRQAVAAAKWPFIAVLGVARTRDAAWCRPMCATILATRRRHTDALAPRMVQAVLAHLRRGGAGWRRSSCLLLWQERSEDGHGLARRAHRRVAAFSGILDRPGAVARRRPSSPAIFFRAQNTRAARRMKSWSGPVLLVILHESCRPCCRHLARRSPSRRSRPPAACRLSVNTTTRGAPPMPARSRTVTLEQRTG